MKKIILLMIVIAVLVTPASMAQQNYKTTSTSNNEKFKPRFTIGVNAAWEPNLARLIPSGVRLESNVRYGVMFDVQLSAHSGIETGIYLRNNNGMISIPLMYKFYSEILNFAAGANIDLDICHKGFKQNEWGLLFKLAKDFRIYKGLSVEPYIQINPTFPLEGCGITVSQIWTSVGVGIKYQF